MFHFNLAIIKKFYDSGIMNISFEHLIVTYHYLNVVTCGSDNSITESGRTNTGIEVVGPLRFLKKKITYTNMKERLGIPSNVIASRHNWENEHG